MPHRDRWTLSSAQQQTILFVVGVALLVYWGITGFDADEAVVGIVAAALAGQKLLGTKGPGDDPSRSAMAAPTDPADPGDDDRRVARRRGGVFRRRVRYA